MKKVLFLLLSLALATSSYAQFKPGNIVAIRIGDGYSGMSANCIVNLLEYTTAGLAVGDPLVIPSETAGNRLVMDLGASTEYSQLRLSANGQYLMFTGSDTTLTAAPHFGTTKVIARVGADKNVDLSTKVMLPKGASVRSAVSDNGSQFWMCNSNGNLGFIYVPYGNKVTSNPNYAIISTNNYRAAQVYNNELYALNGGGNAINLIGENGLPTTTTAPVPAIALPDVNFVAGGICFYLLDQNAKEPGLDVAYVFDGNNNVAYPTKAGNNLLRKFTKVSGTWQEAGSLEVKNFGDGPQYKPELLRDLTGEIDGEGKVVLYAVRGVSVNNAIVSLKDNSGFKGKLTEATTTFKNLVNAGANFSFKGVAFTPGTKAAKAVKK